MKQEFMWQVDIRPGVLCVRDCLSVLLNASIAAAAADAEDGTAFNNLDVAGMM